MMNHYIVTDLISMVPNRTLLTMSRCLNITMSIFTYKYYEVFRKINTLKNLPSEGTAKFRWINDRLFDVWVMSDWEWVFQSRRALSEI